MIRRPPRSTQSRSSATSDVYKRQVHGAAARLELIGQGQSTDRVVEPGAEPSLVLVGERQLVCRARNLRIEHERVLRVHDRGFRSTGEQLAGMCLSLIHISEPTRRTPISYAVFCLK